MQGLDGNYLKMQGDSTVRMQVGLQAEVQAQQLRAQAASDEALRRLHEEVEVLNRSQGQEEGPLGIGPRDAGTSKQPFGSRGDSGSEHSKDVDGESPPTPGLGERLDVRI